MKVKYHAINLLIPVIIIAFSESKGHSAEKKHDPISDSFIINNLQMESDTPPSTYDENGEIIFDNTFDDTFSENRNPAINSKPKQGGYTPRDKRYHLEEYMIKRNESLWSIAKKNGTTVEALIEINSIQDPGHLKENGILMIPSTKGIFYKIRKGDTLTKISQQFNTDIDVIAEHNNIDGRRIIAGKQIFIPGAVRLLKEETVKSKIRIPASEEPEKIAVNKIKEKQAGGRVVLSWPLRGPITSGFGVRTHPFSGDKKFHCGLDIGAEVGTSVKSAGEGKVIYSGWKDGYGNMIVISHKNNYLTIYAHNSKNLVGVNENVKRGQKIALSGKTGAVTGAHLHFEIRKGIVPLNPVRILK